MAISSEIAIFIGLGGFPQKPSTQKCVVDSLHLLGIDRIKSYFIETQPQFPPTVTIPSDFVNRK